MQPKSFILLAMLAAISSPALAGNIYIPVDIPNPHIEAPHLEDPPSKGTGGVELTPELVDALDVGEPGPAMPKPPGGILVVDDPEIIILDDGVGSSGPVKFSPDGKTGNVLVIRLACAVDAKGLVLTNVGNTDAPAGIKLRWRVAGAGKGSLRLEQRLAAGHTATLPGIAAVAGSTCGITLLS